MTRALELQQMVPEELESRLEESRRELFNLRFQLATGQLDNSARLRQVRREVARILTILRQREIEEAEALAAAGRFEVGPLFEPSARSRREDRSAKQAERAEAEGADTRDVHDAEDAEDEEEGA